jgi:hypothetical protein
MQKTLGLLACMGLAACSREPDQPGRTGENLRPGSVAGVAVIKVGGMMKAEGGKT